MNDDIMEAIFKQEQQRKDDEMFNNIQQLAFGNSSNDSILSATSITDPRTLVTTSDTNLYATSSVGSVSYYNTYNKKEVDDASLFMDNKLKILAVSTHSTYYNNMHKFDDTSAISSSYAITEYFNFMYYNNLLTPGYKCSYSINNTNNVVKHNNIFGQTFENIVQKSLFPIRKIAYKWENLHKALI